MPFTEKDKKVARAVIDWLNSVTERAGAEEAESLLAASQCVQSVCSISSNTHRVPSPPLFFSQLSHVLWVGFDENRRLG